MSKLTICFSLVLLQEAETLEIIITLAHGTRLVKSGVSQNVCWLNWRTRVMTSQQIWGQWRHHATLTSRILTLKICRENIEHYMQGAQDFCNSYLLHGSIFTWCIPVTKLKLRNYGVSSIVFTMMCMALLYRSRSPEIASVHFTRKSDIASAF